jgi:23S rRNA (adenine-N6)-dimethyltransferase
VAGRGAQQAPPASRRGRSQHFLRSRRLAADLVRDAEIGRDDLVLEIGAGTGRLTTALALVARRVLALEIDPLLAAALRRRFEGTNVTVLEGDAVARPLPEEPFRVFANLPFHVTAATLRRLLEDPAEPLTAADLIVEWGAARKRAEPWPSTQLGVTWGAWYTFAVARRLPAACFSPRPRVDAGLLAIRRRSLPLVQAEHVARWRRFVREGFARPRLRDGVRGHISERELRRLGDVYGFARAAAPWELDVHQWAAVFHASLVH